MSVGIVGFVIDVVVVVVVEVAVVGAGSMAACVGGVGYGGDSMKDQKFERERELRYCESSN